MVCGDKAEIECHRVVGLLGGICSGKSTVADIFSGYGYRVIDADRIAHNALGCQSVKRKLKEVFGAEIFLESGAVDKKSLADVVFADGAKLSMLNSIVHPEVINAIHRGLVSCCDRAVLDAALLLETELDTCFCTDLIFVDKPFKERQKLSVTGRGWELGEIVRREAMQLPVAEKKEKADIIIDNSGSLQELRESVDKAIRELEQDSD